MLKLVLGGSGSGKTTHLYAQIRARADAGLASILLVPEQFTSSTEGRIYRELGDGQSGLVESFSFTSLAERILEQEGGAAIQTLTDAGRAVLVRRALEELQDQVHYYYRHRRSAAFCQMAAQTIDELKSAGLTGSRLYELAARCGAEKTRLTELALIFQGYETLLAGTGMDPSDRLELAARRLEDAAGRGRLPAFLEGRAVFIDEFDTFNAPKKRLMGAMLAALPEVTVALCDDGGPLTEGDLSLFSGAKRVAAQLKQLARKNGAGVAAPLCLKEDLRHRDAPGLAALGELIAWDSCRTETPRPAPEIRLYPAPSREEEARAAAGAIRRLMRQGVRCGKIAVVCRDLEKYRAAVRYEFRMAEIPLYCDETTTPEFSAPATAVRALLDLARGMDYTENLTALAKTGLTGLTEGQVCALENYAYTWSPGAAAWRQPFEKNPRGFGAADKLTEEEIEQQKAAEQARQILIGPVEELRAKLKNAAAEQISRALYFCLDALGAEEGQAAQVEEIRRLRGIPAAEEAAREWNVVMGLLDQMANLLGGQTVTAAEYADLFGLLLRSSDLGHIPQSLDAVILASAGKMRLDEPDYVFVLGLAEGEFPAAPGETGLLGHADRDALMRQQVELPDCFENRVVREQVCFYKALTAPAKGLWLSWPKGAGLTLCAALGRPQAPFFGLDHEMQPTHRGDLYEMAYPAGALLEEDAVFERGFAFTYPRGIRSAEDITIRTENPAQTGSLLMFRDSFGNALHPFMAERFGAACFSRAMPYNLTYLEREQADTLVIEIVERNLSWLAQRPAVMPAPLRALGGEWPPAPSASVSAQAAESGDLEGYVEISGSIVCGAMDVDSPVYLRTGDGLVYEAFPAGTGDGPFTLYIPAQGASGPLEVGILAGGELCSCPLELAWE